MNKGRMIDNAKMREYVAVNSLDIIMAQMKVLTALMYTVPVDLHIGGDLCASVYVAGDCLEHITEDLETVINETRSAQRRA